MHKLLLAGIALALATPFTALADTTSELKALRLEIEAMRAAYEARLQALEQRLKAAEASTSSPSVAAATAATAEKTAAPTRSPDPVASSSARSTNAFNPSISLILSGTYTHTTQDPANTISGFQLPPDAEVGPGSRGFSLAETELTFAASIDPWFRGQASVAFQQDDSLSVEEAYIQTTALGNGLSLKAGRFFSGIGYLNPQHAHAWDFVDNPLAYQALLGTQYGDDGLQLSWIAPTDLYIELGAEIGRGRSFPGSDTSRNGAGMAALAVHTGGDLGVSHSWRAGLSLLRTKANDQSLAAIDAAGNSVINTFNGNTRVWIADAVWKWAPNGNATHTSFKLQGEYLRSTRRGDLTYDVINANSAAIYRAVQSGWYLQGVYQFLRQWRVGLRTERLSAGAPDYGLNAGLFASSTYHPYKNTMMLDFNPSEFSRIRLQFAQDRSHEGLTDNQFFLQYQMSLGAHGAHRY